jgi:hypothetical protein
MNRSRAFVLPRGATQAALAGAPIGMLGGRTLQGQIAL